MLMDSHDASHDAILGLVLSADIRQRQKYANYEKGLLNNQQEIDWFIEQIQSFSIQMKMLHKDIKIIFNC